MFAAHDTVALSGEFQAVLAGKLQVFGSAGRVEIDERPDVETTGRSMRIDGRGRYVRQSGTVVEDAVHVVGQVLHRYAHILDAGERLVLTTLPH